MNPRPFAPRRGFLAGFGASLGSSLLYTMPPLAQTVRPQPGSSAPSANTAPEQNPVTTFADAIRVLGHERSVAEAYGMLLDTHGKKDMSRYVEGIRLYSEAKADFDGLLEQLKYNLNEGRDPKNSAQFEQVLEAAAQSGSRLLILSPKTSWLMRKGQRPAYRTSSRRFPILLRY